MGGTTRGSSEVRSVSRPSVGPAIGRAGHRSGRPSVSRPSVSRPSVGPAAVSRPSVGPAAVTCSSRDWRRRSGNVRSWESVRRPSGRPVVDRAGEGAGMEFLSIIGSGRAGCEHRRLAGGAVRPPPRAHRMAGAPQVGSGTATGRSADRRDNHRESLRASPTGAQPGGRPGSNGGTPTRGRRSGRPTAATDTAKRRSPATPIGFQAPTFGNQARPPAFSRSNLGRVFH